MMALFMDYRVGTLVVTIVALAVALVWALFMLKDATRELEPWNHETMLYWLTSRRDWHEIGAAPNTYETPDGLFRAHVFHDGAGLHVEVQYMSTGICATLHAAVTLGGLQHVRRTPGKPGHVLNEAWAAS